MDGRLRRSTLLNSNNINGFNMKDDVRKSGYVPPETVIVECGHQEVICISCSSDQIGIASWSFDEDVLNF